MFNWLFGTTCDFCKVKIPRGKIYCTRNEFNYCSEYCLRTDEEIEEYFDPVPKEFNDLTDFEKRRFHQFQERANTQKKKMERFYQMEQN